MKVTAKARQPPTEVASVEDRLLGTQESVNLNLRGRLWRRHSRESGNPGRLTPGCCLQLLDARLRGHDDHEPLKIIVTEY